MRRQVLGLAIGAGIALIGCASGRHTYLSAHHPADAPACANWRWIGIRSSSAPNCPDPRWGWKVDRLFQMEKRDQEQYRVYGQERQPEKADRQRGPSPEEVEAELDRFCVYETVQPLAAALGSPVSKDAGFERLDRDCATISVAADLTASTWAGVSDHFLEQAGKPTAPLDIRNHGGVRLAFIDTEPTREEVPATPGRMLDGEIRPMHGYTLAHIARHLVCSPRAEARPETGETPESWNNCAALITTRLALPGRRFDPWSWGRNKVDPVRGGGVGMQGDLAEAIRVEVDDWRAKLPQPGAPQHLVLNLSLGWDPELTGGLDKKALGDLQAGTQAIYRALQYAASRDVLVLAAAGNRKNCCPLTEGPLLPAGWEGDSRPDDRLASSSEPLLYAVGGVRSDGTPLRNARDLGMPERAAYGENAIVSAFGRDHTTWLYTGSSVATAVVSSTAAVVWDSVPSLDRQGVMKVLDESGTPLSFGADFWFGGGLAPTSRRISLCTALTKACEPGSALATSPGAHCPLVGEYACPAWQPERTTFPGWAAQPLSTSCHPWVVPQPEDPPCLPCRI